MKATSVRSQKFWAGAVLRLPAEQGRGTAQSALRRALEQVAQEHPGWDLEVLEVGAVGRADDSGERVRQPGQDRRVAGTAEAHRPG